MPDQKEMQKEMEDFAVRLVGAFTGALEDFALEGHYTAAGGPRTFPYTEINPNLPPGDDLIIGGLALPPWLIGLLLEEDAKKKGDAKTQQMARTVRIFGEGDVCYSLPMLVYTTLWRSAHCTWDPYYAGRVSQPTVNRPVEQGRPAGQIVVKL